MTDTGIGTVWMADGMNSAARLITTEKYAKFVTVAKHYLGHDSRITFHVMDARTFLTSQQAGTFDLLNHTLRLLKPGGLYLIDHLPLQAADKEDYAHVERVTKVIATLEQQPDLIFTRMSCSTGLVLVAKRQGVRLI